MLPPFARRSVSPVTTLRNAPSAGPPVPASRERGSRAYGQPNYAGIRAPSDPPRSTHNTETHFVYRRLPSRERRAAAHQRGGGRVREEEKTQTPAGRRRRDGGGKRGRKKRTDDDDDDAMMTWSIKPGITRWKWRPL